MVPLEVKDHFAGVTMNKAVIHSHRETQEQLQRTGLTEYSKAVLDMQVKHARLIAQLRS